VFHRSSFSARSFSERSWRFPVAEPAAGLADRIGGGGRLRGGDDDERIRAAWDEIDALRRPLPAGQVGAPLPAAGADTADQAGAVRARPSAAIDVLLPSGKRASVDPATLAITVPAEGFTDEDMEAALLALCLLDFDD
jgi:hypothetical protein